MRFPRAHGLCTIVLLKLLNLTFLGTLCPWSVYHCMIKHTNSQMTQIRGEGRPTPQKKEKKKNKCSRKALDQRHCPIKISPVQYITPCHSTECPV